MKSNKQRRIEIKLRRARKALQAARETRRGLIERGRLVVADPSKVNLGNSYAMPPSMYRDEAFLCRDCGEEQVWTAKQQQWWFEEVGALYWRKAVRCRPCRIKERLRKEHARRTSLEGQRRKAESKARKAER